MPTRRHFLASALGLPALAAARAAEPAPRARLAVLLIFDQLRGDYLTRWHGQFGAGGFRRLTGDGAWFQNCHYPYAMTKTGPGHASLSTGRLPRSHAVVGNDWYDRDTEKSVNCVGSDRYKQVPPLPTGPLVRKPRSAGSASPERLVGPTLADAFKEATGGKGRVVALSFKDRGAVLPGGRRPDACYWFDSNQGLFVTSTYYRDHLHPWVEEYNRGRPADAWFGKTWERLRPDLDYDQLAGPDDQPGEGRGIAQGRTFPHPTDGAQQKPGMLYYEALYNSPFGNELLLGLVKKAVTAEGLGQNDVPDLLCVSFSCNDPLGHCWGPDSHEVLDCTLRSDRLVADLLGFLDGAVGRGRYGVVLSADHGICPLPEVARDRGHSAARIDAHALADAADEFLAAAFAPTRPTPTRFVAALDNDQFYLDRATLRGLKLDPAKVEDALAKWVVGRPGIQAAYTRTQLLQGPLGDDLGRLVQASFHPERCGDVLFVVKPYHFTASRPTGTTHGAPHDYDRHVPLVVYGPGVKAGVRRAAVTPLAAAPVLARFLGVPAPAGGRDTVPDGLFAPGPAGKPAG